MTGDRPSPEQRLASMLANLPLFETPATPSPWPVDALVQLLRETDPARMGKGRE